MSAFPDVTGVLRDVPPATDMEPAGLDPGQVALDRLDLSGNVSRQRRVVIRAASLLPKEGIVIRRNGTRLQVARILAVAALELVEPRGLVPEIGVGGELVLQLVSQFIEEFGRRHIGEAVRSAIGDLEEP